MADVVVYDPLDGTVANRVTQYLTSVNTPDYSGNPNTLINPTITAVLDRKYWKWDGATSVIDMSGAEQTAIDAAEAAANTAQYRSGAVDKLTESSDLGVEIRELIELFNKRDNYLTNRITELQEDLQAIKASSGGTANIRDAIRASYLATNTRTRAAAITDYTDDINAGNADT